MSFQPGATVYTQGFGTRAENVEVPFLATRAPASTDINFPVGKRWLDTTSQAEYVLGGLSTSLGVTSATWTVLGGGTSDVSTINTLSPTGGNITIAGTSNQVTVSNAGSTVTLSTPSAFTAPGSITATTTLTATAGAITATNGNLVLGTAGNKISSTNVATTTTAGANSFGTVTLSSGTATIATTAVTASSKIVLTRQSPGATGAAALGQLSVGTITGSTSFVINALTTADSTAVATTDVSSIFWMIIN